MQRKELITYLVFIFLLILLLVIPTGFQKSIYYNSENCKAIVLEVDNSSIYSVGHFRQGEQIIKSEIVSGSKKGEVVKAVNLLGGKLETDKLFKVDDSVMVLIEKDDDDNIIAANTVDYYRVDKEIVLILLFAVLLIIFAGRTGLKTILSFTFTILMIIKVLVPMMLKGYDPLLVSLVVGVFISTFTILLISGFNVRSYSAIFATMISGLITLALALFFSQWMKLDGTTMEWSESLIYAGYENLRLMEIFRGAVYLSCLGAIIDLSIDISSALWEIKENNKDVKYSDLFKSGMNIGKTVVGSQATTLLLAYMGSYLTVIMVYMAQGTPVLNILTSKAIAAEILNTFVGTIALISVPPITSLLSGYFLSKTQLKETNLAGN